MFLAMDRKSLFGFAIAISAIGMLTILMDWATVTYYFDYHSVTYRYTGIEMFTSGDWVDGALQYSSLIVFIMYLISLILFIVKKDKKISGWMYIVPVLIILYIGRYYSILNPGVMDYYPDYDVRYQMGWGPRFAAILAISLIVVIARIRKKTDGTDEHAGPAISPENVEGKDVSICCQMCGSRLDVSSTPPKFCPDCGAEIHYSPDFKRE